VSGATAVATAGDVHATVRATVNKNAELSVSYTGGWSIVPPAMPAKIGNRSEAPRVLSERLTADGRYAVSLEGLAGRSYTFGVKAPDAGSPVVQVSAGGVAAVSGRPGERQVKITFPSTGANADGYTAAVVTFGGGNPSPRTPR
jgi:hypothetical protein